MVRCASSRTLRKTAQTNLLTVFVPPLTTLRCAKKRRRLRLHAGVSRCSFMSEFVQICDTKRAAIVRGRSKKSARRPTPNGRYEIFAEQRQVDDRFTTNLPPIHCNLTANSQPANGNIHAARFQEFSFMISRSKNCFAKMMPTYVWRVDSTWPFSNRRPNVDLDALFQMSSNLCRPPSALAPAYHLLSACFCFS